MTTVARYLAAAVAALALLVSPAAADCTAGYEALDKLEYPTAHAELLACALEDDAAAQYQLGLMLANGTGVPKDVISAYAWLALADRGGVAEARDDHKLLIQEHLPRYCQYDALGLVRQYLTGDKQRLAEGDRQNSRCWEFQKPSTD